MLTEDKILLGWFLKGFIEEMSENSSVVEDNPLYLKAYTLGANHAATGENIEVVGNSLDEKVLNLIRKKTMKEILDKFENGQERYNIDPQFNVIMCALFSGMSEYKVIDILLKKNKELNEILSQFIQRDSPSSNFYKQIENDIQSKQSEIDKMFIKVKSLYEKGKSDSAIVYIFDIIDDWSLDEEYKFDELFQTFYGSKFNEDIYIALLSSTISVKHNKFRGMYFRYIKNELNKIHNEKNLNVILSGL